MLKRVIYLWLGVALLWPVCSRAQGAAPPPPPPPGRREGPPPARPQSAEELARRLDDIGERLARTQVDTVEGRELKTAARTYLDRARASLAQHDLFTAARFAEASDACRRPLEHLERIGSKAPAPPGPGPEARDDLRRVYFRLRLAGFFLEQLPEPRPVRLLEIAKLFYNRALQAQGNHQASEAREYLANSDDVTHALESLAQANSDRPAARPK